MGFRRRLREHLRPWVIVLPAAGCAHAAGQADHTGLDGWYTGAPVIALVDGEARAADHVSYQDGDRVDWRILDLPAGQRGKLELRIDWRPDHDDVELRAFLYDGAFEVIDRARSRGRHRIMRLAADDVGGRTYVQIYAPRRRDGAGYRLHARFIPVPPAPIVIAPPPPALPAVPDPPPTPPPPRSCFDRGAASTMHCNPPPNCIVGSDRVICFPEVCDVAPFTDPRCKPCDPVEHVGRLVNCNPPAPEPAPVHLHATIVTTSATSSGTVITLSHGSNAGVDRGWKGVVLDASGKPVPHGTFVIIKVTRTSSMSKVELPAARLRGAKVDLSSR